MDTTCLLSLVLWFWARGSFCVDSEGKIQDFSVPFHLLFSCLQLFRPCPHSCLTCFWWFDDRKTSQTLLCMVGYGVPHFSSATMCPTMCPTMSHNVSHILMRWLPHTCAHIIEWRRLFFRLRTDKDKDKNKEVNKENYLSRWHWKFEKEKAYLRQKSTEPIIWNGKL